MTDDALRLIRLAVATAVKLLETQDGILFPIAHAVDAQNRTAFIGAYNGNVAPHPLRALDTLRELLRRRPFRCTAIVYGITMPDDSGRNALCIEYESQDAPAQTVLVPFVITRPWLRAARVITYAPVYLPGANRVMGNAATQVAMPPPA